MKPDLPLALKFLAMADGFGLGLLIGVSILVWWGVLP